MNKICCLDVETLGVSSESVMLSVAITFIELGKSQYYFQELVDNSFYVKFNVKEQIENYKRTTEKDCINWWKKQTEPAKEFSFYPSSNDLSAETGIKLFTKYIKEQCDPNSIIVFTRGNLDSMVLDSLTKQVKQPLIFPYSSYRDVRTYIEYCSEKSVKGYCDVNLELFPDYHKDKIWKHIPTLDCILDLMMIISC